MSESILPDTAPEIGRILISVGLAPEGGIAVAYKVTDLSPEAAVGYLITTSDLLREKVKDAWYVSEAVEDEEDDEDGL